MELLCKVCNKFVVEKYTINNPNLDETDELLNEYVTSYNIKFDIFAIRCQFFLVFDNKFKIHKETGKYFNNDALTEIKKYLLYWIDYYKSQGYGFCNIKKIIIKTITNKHWMSHKIYIQYAMQMIERRMNVVIDRCPELINTLDCRINHPIIRKTSHICLQ